MTSQNCSNVDAASFSEQLATMQLCQFRLAKDLTPSHEKQGHHAWCCLYGKSSQLNHQLSGEAGLHLYNGCCWPIVSIYFFHDSSAEPACWRPWEHQSEHNTNVYLCSSPLIGMRTNPLTDWASSGTWQVLWTLSRVRYKSSSTYSFIALILKAESHRY